MAASTEACDCTSSSTVRRSTPSAVRKSRPSRRPAARCGLSSRASRRRRCGRPWRARRRSGGRSRWSAGDDDDLLVMTRILCLRSVTLWRLMSGMVRSMPPLARSVWPLIQAPSGPARKATAAAMSSGCAEPFQRGHLGEAVDHFLRLAVEEQVRRGRPRRDGVDRDVAAAQFLGQDRASSPRPPALVAA